MAGQAALFYMTSKTDTESSIGIDKKIEFDGNAASPDTKSGIATIERVLEKSRPTNPHPFADEVTKQDTGYQGSIITLNLVFNEEAGEALGPRRIMEWMSRPQTVADFPHGRIGFRCDWMNEFDLVPTAKSGYKIVHYSDTKNLLFSTYRQAKIILEHSGDPTALKGPTDEAAE